MNTAGFRRWYSGKIQLTDQLIKNHSDNATPDAEILLCCVNSALAAMMWPGDRIDQKRFIQFLIDFAPKETTVHIISIPVLMARLKDKGGTALAQVLVEKFYPKSDVRVLKGHEIDQPEAAVIELLPTLSIKEIRHSSYASIIYTDLRCGLVHEYQLSSYLSSIGMSDAASVPSYVNILREPDEAEVDKVAKQFGISHVTARSAISTIDRRLHFPYMYIRNTLSRAAEAAFDCWDTMLSWKKPKPSSWWIEGK